MKVDYVEVSDCRAIERELREEIGRLRKDAERYRWLFPDTGDSVLARVMMVYRQWDGQSEWDAAIDATFADQEKEPRP